MRLASASHSVTYSCTLTQNLLKMKTNGHTVLQHGGVVGQILLYVQLTWEIILINDILGKG